MGALRTPRALLLSLLLLPVAIVLGALTPLPVRAHADGIELPGGDFAAEAKAKHGQLLELEGLVLAKGSRATRFRAPAPHAHALRLGRRARLHVTLEVPPPLHPDKLDASGWYGVASIDVLGMAAKGEGTLRMVARAGGPEGTRLCSASIDVRGAAPKGAARRGRSVESPPAVQRLWLRIPVAGFARLAGRELTLSLEADGAKGIVVSAWRLDRFHAEPARSLVGKPNGKNGPDLLACGPLGLVGLTEHERTAFSLLTIREGGAAAKAGLRRDDLIVGIGGTPLPPGSLAAGRAWFDAGHEATLGRALLAALDAGQRTLTLTVLRDPGPKEVTLRLPRMKHLALTFPFDEAGVSMLEDALAWVVAHQRKDGAWGPQPIVNSALSGLALLGTRDRTHRKALRALADFLLTTNPTAEATKGFSFWPIAFQGIFLCEYHLATGDPRALAWVRDAIAWLPSTTHESRWGMPAFGHSPKGLPYDDKALMAPCAHLLVFEALAAQCGVEGRVFEHLRPYVVHSWSDPETKKGHGGMGYNGSHKDRDEAWSRTGLTALALHLSHREPRMREGLIGFLRVRHPWLLNSHAYGEPGGALGLLSLAVVAPEVFAEVMSAWRWRFVGAWEPGFGLRYSSPLMGAPYMGEEAILNPAYALLLGIRDKGLVLMGAEPTQWLGPRTR